MRQCDTENTNSTGVAKEKKEAASDTVLEKPVALGAGLGGRGNSKGNRLLQQGYGDFNLGRACLVLKRRSLLFYASRRSFEADCPRESLCSISIMLIWTAAWVRRRGPDASQKFAFQRSSVKSPWRKGVAATPRKTLLMPALR